MPTVICEKHLSQNHSHRHFFNQNPNPSKNLGCWLWAIGFFVVTISAIIFGWIAYYKHLQATTPDIINPPTSLPLQSAKALQQQGIFADKVYVKKSTRTLQLIHDGEVIRQYHIALGDNPQGHKQQEGDERTPEGWYTLDWANENSTAYRSLHISYPNSLDSENAQKRGVSAGGDIMIHGQMNGAGALAGVSQMVDWTNGCIAVTNAEMDEIMALVKVGTPILIEW